MTTKFLCFWSCVFFMSLELYSASVEWNTMRTYSWTIWGDDVTWELSFDQSSKLDSLCEFTLSPSGNGSLWRMVADSALSGCWTGMRVERMDAGSVVSKGTIGRNGFFYETHAGGGDLEMRSDYDIYASEGEPIYLGIAVDSEVCMLEDGSFYSSPVYGWAGLMVADGEVHVLGSAFDLDGGGMIVGGGAIPEPSSATLLLVGLAGLCLKRKRAGA